MIVIQIKSDRLRRMDSQKFNEGSRLKARLES